MMFVSRLLLFCWLVSVVSGQSDRAPVEKIASTSVSPTSAPGTSESVPVTSTSKPGISESVPVTSPSTSVTSPSTSVTSPSTSLTSESVPVTSTSKPGTSESVPVTSTSKPGTSESVPVTSPSTSVTSPSTSVTSPSTSLTSESVPVTSTSTPGTSVPVTSTTKPNACSSNPCKGNSQCELGYEPPFTCVCPIGEIYSSKEGCERAKVFRGNLILVNEVFNDKMKDPTTKEFHETALKFTNPIREVFKTNGNYVKSTVLDLRSTANGRSFWSRGTSGVTANLEHVFNPSSDIDQNDVNQKITDAIKSCEKIDPCSYPGLENAKYDGYSLCVMNLCEESSALCNSASGQLECECLSGYIKTNYSNTACQACQSGKKAEGDMCVDCPFGYSGFNCDESWKLLLVIVATVLGALLLISLILLPIVARKTHKNSSPQKPSSNTELPAYTSPYPSKDFKATSSVTGGPVNASSGSAGFPKIPRAMSNSNSYNRGSNLEMTESGSRQALVPRTSNGLVSGYQNPDNSRNFSTRNPYQSGGQSNPPYQSGGQSNPPYQSAGQSNNPYQSAGQSNNPYQSAGQSNNPYQSAGQSNPNSNPYQSRRGQDNPYFTNDNERRY
ncbi:hypothetical protein DPEC_G00354750 [Dallia pectoralis]|uniref:Uncharacterized protein n=1 Tax=Dallia pectoralis TaxID=75939 RepID=A0ACC2EZB2_DALPE|nr:hypothetical protein DPEC_G00354750 [Dallia pectoralis]